MVAWEYRLTVDRQFYTLIVEVRFLLFLLCREASYLIVLWTSTMSEVSVEVDRER